MLSGLKAGSTPAEHPSNPEGGHGKKDREKDENPALSASEQTGGNIPAAALENQGRVGLSMEAFRQTDRALALVKEERIRADVKFGFFRDYPDLPRSTVDRATLRVALLEALRDCRFLNDRAPTWNSILTEEAYEAFLAETEEQRAEELIQVAAVAVAWHEAIIRRRDERGIQPVKKLSWWQRLRYRITGRVTL